jgi:hypothetical protein
MEATASIPDFILEAANLDVGLTNVLAPNLQCQPCSDVRLLWADATVKIQTDT